MPTRRRPAGFTLVELMIVVVILGVLATIAIPAFAKYVRRARTGEAVLNLKKMFDGSVAYYERDWGDRFGRGLADQFPISSPPAGSPPNNSCCGNVADICEPDPELWADPTWMALRFSVNEPHRYWYRYVSVGLNNEARFTAMAMGNLNCNLSFSTFERIGRVNAQGDIVGGAGVFKVRALE